MRSSREVRDPAGLPNLSRWLSVSSPPSLGYLPDMCREQVQGNNSSVHSVAVPVLWQNGSHQIIIFILLHLPFSSYREKSKLNFLLAVTMPVFRLGPLDIFELFSNSTSSIFGGLSRGPSSCLIIMKTIWSEQTRGWWSPWVSLAFSVLGCLFKGPASCLTVPRTWVDLIRTVPLGLQKNSSSVSL